MILFFVILIVAQFCIINFGLALNEIDNNFKHTLHRFQGVSLARPIQRSNSVSYEVEDVSYKKYYSMPFDKAKVTYAKTRFCMFAAGNEKCIDIDGYSEPGIRVRLPGIILEGDIFGSKILRERLKKKRTQLL